MVEFFKKLNLASLMRFALGGVLSSGITLGSTALLHEVGSVHERVAAAIGLLLALTVNFGVLRFFVFKGTRQPVMRQLVMFLGSSGVFRAIEYCGFLLLSQVLKVQYLLAMLATLGVSFILKFAIYELWIFRRGRENEPAGQIR